jgi:hypothetical protein
MPLTPAERTDVAVAFLECFGEDAYHTGRTLLFMSRFASGGSGDLLAAYAARALTWQPFIDSGLSIQAFIDEVTRIYNTDQQPA